MLTLDLTNAPRWHDLAPGVRVQLRPLTTALMVATRSEVCFPYWAAASVTWMASSRVGVTTSARIGRFLPPDGSLTR